MTNLFRSHTTRLALLIGGLLPFYVMGATVRRQYGIGIAARNECGETLRQVSLKVESIGDRASNMTCATFASGGRAHSYVSPVTESHINLEFTEQEATCTLRRWLAMLSLDIPEPQRQQF